MVKLYEKHKSHKTHFSDTSKKIEIDTIIMALKSQIPYLEMAISDMHNNRIPEAHGRISGVITVLNDIIKRYE